MITFIIALGWGLGLTIYYLAFPAKLTIILLALVLLVWMIRISSQRMALILLAIILGSLWGLLDDYRASSKLAQIIELQGNEQMPIVATGTIHSFPVVDGDRLRFLFLTENVGLEDRDIQTRERLWVSVRLLSEEEQFVAKNLSRGDTLELKSFLSTPKPPTNPGAFDFPRYLWQQYTEFQVMGEGINTIQVVETSSVFGWKGITYIRNLLENRIDQIFSTDNSGLMKGMLIGEQQEVSVELENIYRDTGIIHILAISGTHVLLVIGALVLVLRMFRITLERTYEVVLLFLPFYMILTGLSPSVVRASLMGIIYLIARRLHYQYSALHSISLVFILTTLLKPRLIFAVGFQLSFVVTLGLILCTQPFSNQLKKYFQRLPNKLISAFSFTFVAQIFAFPILVMTFYQFPLASIPINLLLMPVYALIIPWGYLSMVLAVFWPHLGKIIAYPLDGILAVIHLFLQQIVKLSYSVLSFKPLPTWWWGIYILLSILILVPLHLKRFWKIGITLLCVILISMPFLLSWFDSSIRVTFLDVGQGDSIVIQGPRNQTILIDGGGEGYVFPNKEWQKRRNPYDVGKNVVIPALRSLGINEINWLVISHGDSDHIGGLLEVVRQIPIKNVLINGVQATTELEKELQYLIEEANIPVYIATKGPWLKWQGDIMWEVLNPSHDSSFSSVNDNDESVVLLLSAYNRKVLFTGDLEENGEIRILEDVHNMNIDVLKVGHHGSKTSTSDLLLESTLPKVAVISVGGTNRYGHPNAVVLDRLVKKQVEVYRTDHHGAITFTIHSDGVMTYKLWK